MRVISQLLKHSYMHLPEFVLRLKAPHLYLHRRVLRAGSEVGVAAAAGRLWRGRDVTDQPDSYTLTAAPDINHVVKVRSTFPMEVYMRQKKNKLTRPSPVR